MKDQDAAVDALFTQRRSLVRECDFNDGQVLARIDAVLLELDAQREIDGRAEGVNPHLLALEVLGGFDRRIGKHEERILRVAGVPVLIVVGDDGHAFGNDALEHRGGKHGKGERRHVRLPGGEQGAGFGCAAGEGHIDRVVLAVSFQHVLLHPLEVDDGFHLVGADAPAGGIADRSRRGAREAHERHCECERAGAGRSDHGTTGERYCGDAHHVLLFPRYIYRYGRAGAAATPSISISIPGCASVGTPTRVRAGGLSLLK
jgi:hypothetical protein